MNALDCTCEAGYRGQVYHCPLHLAALDMYEALKDIKLIWTLGNIRLPARTVDMIDKALAKAEGGE